MKHIFVLFLLCVVSPFAVFASADDSLVVMQFEYYNNRYEQEETDEPVKSGSIIFSRCIGLTDTARVELRDENGVVATSGLTASSVLAYFDFGKEYSFPKGKRFSLVLVGGSVYKLTTKEVMKDDFQKQYRVPKDFGVTKRYQFPQKMKSLQAGLLAFDVSISNECNAKMLLYREGELVDACNLGMQYFQGEPPTQGEYYLRWDFGKEVFLDEGANYKFVLPAGSVSSKNNSDIKNRETTFEIVGLGKDSPVGIEDKFEVEDIMYAYNGYGREVTDVPVKSGNVTFSGAIGLTDTARLELHDENGVVATTPLRISDTSKTMASFDFGEYIYPTIGKPFWLVLAKGSVYELAHPTNFADEVKKRYVVMESFANNCFMHPFPEVTSTLSTVELFFDLSIRKSNDAQILLYREGELLEKYDFDVRRFDGTGRICCDFGEGVHLDKDVHYKFVLPAGSVSSYFRDDIKNREICYDIIGLGNDNTTVSAIVDGGISVTFRGNVLHVDNVRQGDNVEVYSCDGRLVQRAKAAQASVEIPMPGKGCYVVRVGGKTVKGVLN